MTITSTGYAGTIDEVNEAIWSTISTFGAEYSCGYGSDDPSTTACKVTAVTGPDRTVRVAVGPVWGKGVFDVNDAPVDIQLDPVGSGSRWDTIVARRNRTTRVTTFVALQGTATRGISGSRVVGWVDSGGGAIDDQPLALARVAFNSSAIQEVIDLRCWAANGNVYANEQDALGYLNANGGTVWIQGALWAYEVSPAGTASWVRLIPNIDVVDNVLHGVWSGQRIKERIRRRNFTTDVNGDVIIMPLADFSGIVSARVDGTTSTWVHCQTRIEAGNLVARLWDINGLRQNTTFAGIATIRYW